MKLKTIHREDFPLWKAMRQEVYHVIGESFHDKEMRMIHTSDDWHCWFITDVDGEIIGLVEVSIRKIVDGCLTSPVPYLEGLFIMPGHRALGLGTVVMGMLLDWAADQGYEEFATDAELENTRAQNFYEKLAFEEVDRVVVYRRWIKERNMG
jgi:aminoglycoside 6'-N-acetyltransferase I